MDAESTKSKKYFWMTGVVAILILLNYFQYGWEQENDKQRSNIASGISVTPEDLQLVALDEQTGVSEIKRDIFISKIEIPKKDKERKITKNVKIPTKTIKEIKKQPTKEELMRQAAENELGQFHYIGLVKKEGKKQAFLLFKDQSYIAKPGLIINGKYRVEKIDETKVIVKEQNTGISKTLVLTDE